MRRIPASLVTEAARTVEARSLLDSEPQHAAALLWARLKAHEHALEGLLLEGVRRLFSDELALQPAQVRATALDLLDRAADCQGPFVLRLHPEDLSLLEGLGRDLELRPDAMLQRGGCILEAPGIELDASVETRLSRVLEALSGGA